MRPACRGRAGRLALSGTPYRNIARIVKARGLDGKVLVRCTEGLPFCIYEGLEVHVVPPALTGVRCGHIASVESVDGDACVAAIEGVDSIDAAEELAGRYLLALDKDLDLNPEDDMVLVIGRDVVADDGRALGTVTEYLTTKANDVLVIERPGGGELLVPIIEETIVAVPDSEEEPLVVHLLEGLEEL